MKRMKKLSIQASGSFFVEIYKIPGLRSRFEPSNVGLALFIMSCSTYLLPALASSQIDIESIDAGQAKSWVSELITNQCFVVLTITALVYDAILTMDKEARMTSCPSLFTTSHG
ncbi:hypothetical protein ACEPAF_10018 [Sanghuangporus sanghuang]